MRSFVISVIIILLCFCIATVNCIWTSSLISEFLCDIPDLTKADAADFSKRWSSCEKFLFFTSRRSFLRDIADEIKHLEASAENGDDFEFDAAKKSLIYKMEELCRSHSFDIKTIL